MPLRWEENLVIIKLCFETKILFFAVSYSPPWRGMSLRLNENLESLHQTLNYKSQSFIKRKFVVHKPELKTTETHDYSHSSP
jgi:hypothetical protein